MGKSSMNGGLSREILWQDLHEMKETNSNLVGGFNPSEKY